MRGIALRAIALLARIALWVVGGIAALLVVLIAAILIAANIPPGRHLIAREVTSLTGGMVRIAGIGGRFPDALRVREVEIDDSAGTWLTLHDLVLDWHPLALAGMTISADRLAATEIDVARLPVPSPPPAKPVPASQGGGFSLPFGLRLGSLDIGAVDIGAPVAGHAMTLSVHGHATIASLQPIIAGPTPETLPASDISLVLADAAGRGRYTLDGDVTEGGISLHLAAHEAAGGVIATFAHSDQISPLALDLALDGPRRATALRLTLALGKLAANADGLVDLPDRSARISIDAHAPAMQPVPGVSWQSLALSAHLRGKLSAPQADGNLAIGKLAAGAASVGDIKATLRASEGPIALRAVLSAIRIPGPKPDLLAGSPLTLVASARLDQPTRPAHVEIGHALFTVVGDLATAPGIGGHVAITLPDLAPLAAAGNLALAGHAAFAADIAMAGADASASITGKLAIIGGMAPVVALIGPDGTLALTAHKHGSDLTLDRLALDGRALHAGAGGTLQSNVVDARFHIGLPSLPALSASVAGHLAVDGTAHGPTNDLAATVHAAGDVGAHGIAPEPLTLDVAAAHLPSAPTATIALGGRLDGSPVALAADIARGADGAATVHLGKLSWKSLGGHADLAFAPKATLPTGSLALGIGRLADFSRLAGMPLAGAVKASLDATGPTARIGVTADGLAAAGAKVAHLALAGTVADPTHRPDLDLHLDASAISSGAITANAKATARGTLDALALGLGVDIGDLDGAPAHVALASLLDAGRSTLTLRTLTADWHGEALRLQAPSRIVYAPSVSVERLRLGLGSATIAVDGRITPTLALTASLHDLTPALAAPIMPDLKAAGRADIDAHLTGTTASPRGRITVVASGLRLLTGPAASLPTAGLTADATLEGNAARIEAHVQAGRRVALAVQGVVPIKAGGALDVRSVGNVDLSVANPILEQQGRHLTGQLAIDARATGSTAQPVLGGSVSLSHGDIQDFAQGLHLTDIAASLALAGQTVRIDHFSARAGSGTIGAAGTVDVLTPSIPIDLHLTMDHASPVSSDLLTAVLNAAVDVTGHASGTMSVRGHVTIDRADINIPNGLPPSVATLNVIKPGQKPPAPPLPGAPARVIVLDLDLAAPGQIFVRGHGLDAVLGGKLHAGGTATAPEISGGFELRRGTFSLAGTSLTFTKGNVGFNGTTNGHLDPTIDFLAESFVNQYTAALEVTGYASAPKIKLSSTPPLPQDQVMALLLFGSDTKSLSPLQIAQIAAALASLSGVGGGFDPLATVRNSLGLDRLSVGSGGGNGNNTGASIEGGKYVTKRVYVGAKQSTSGGGTQALVQIDLTKRLKAFTTVGTGGTVTGATTPENDPGSSVGLKYQFRY